MYISNKSLRGNISVQPNLRQVITKLSCRENWVCVVSLEMESCFGERDCTLCCSWDESAQSLQSSPWGWGMQSSSWYHVRWRTRHRAGEERVFDLLGLTPAPAPGTGQSLGRRNHETPTSQTSPFISTFLRSRRCSQLRHLSKGRNEQKCLLSFWIKSLTFREWCQCRWEPWLWVAQVLFPLEPRIWCASCGQVSSKDGHGRSFLGLWEEGAGGDPGWTQLCSLTTGPPLPEHECLDKGESEGGGGAVSTAGLTFPTRASCENLLMTHLTLKPRAGISQTPPLRPPHILGLLLGSCTPFLCLCSNSELL